MLGRLAVWDRVRAELVRLHGFLFRVLRLFPLGIYPAYGCDEFVFFQTSIVPNAQARRD
jgi:hypothetical protein